jgi:hypothetical protein
MTKQRTPAAERLYRARRAAAKELKLPITSWQVRRFALLMVGHDNLTAKLANGVDVSIDNLLRIDAAMAQVRSSVPQEPIKVDVEFVEGPIEHCPKCGWHRDEPLPPDPPPPAPLPTETKPSPPAPLPAAASNVVELPRRGGSIHDAILPDGTPARMARSELWRYGAASDPVLEWGAAHSLPPIPPECFPK